MSGSESPYITTPIEEADTHSGFSCGKRPLDDYFARHAFPNHVGDVGRAYVLHKVADTPANHPAVLGFYTLNMAAVESAPVAAILQRKLPKYSMPVALIGRLAVARQAQGQRIGEKLLMDALRRVVDAANIVACLGVIVDAKDSDALAFYGKYDFVEVTHEEWPRRMFLPIDTARAAFAGAAKEDVGV